MATKPVEDVVQGQFNQVEDQIEAKKWCVSQKVQFISQEKSKPCWVPEILELEIHSKWETSPEFLVSKLKPINLTLFLTLILKMLLFHFFLAANKKRFKLFFNDVFIHQYFMLQDLSWHFGWNVDEIVLKPHNLCYIIWHLWNDYLLRKRSWIIAIQIWLSLSINSSGND